MEHVVREQKDERGGGILMLKVKKFSLLSIQDMLTEFSLRIGRDLTTIKQLGIPKAFTRKGMKVLAPFELRASQLNPKDAGLCFVRDNYDY